MPGEDLERAELVFVKVERVEFVDVEAGVGVSLPATAKIDGFEDAADLVVTGEREADGVVLAVADIGEIDAAEDGGVEGAGSAEAIDAEGVIAAIFGCPLFVIDHPGRDFLEVEVRHFVRADHHGAFLAAEGIDDFLEGGLVLVEVVAVELDGEAPAGGVVDALIPAAPDEEVLAFGNDVDEALVLFGGGSEEVGGSIGRVVVDDDEIEGK